MSIDCAYSEIIPAAADRYMANPWMTKPRLAGVKYIDNPVNVSKDYTSYQNPGFRFNTIGMPAQSIDPVIPRRSADEIAILVKDASLTAATMRIVTAARPEVDGPIFIPPQSKPRDPAEKALTIAKASGPDGPSVFDGAQEASADRFDKQAAGSNINKELVAALDGALLSSPDEPMADRDVKEFREAEARTAKVAAQFEAGIGDQPRLRRQYEKQHPTLRKPTRGQLDAIMGYLTSAGETGDEMEVDDVSMLGSSSSGGSNRMQSVIGTGSRRRR